MEEHTRLGVLQYLLNGFNESQKTGGSEKPLEYKIEKVEHDKGVTVFAVNPRDPSDRKQVAHFDKDVKTENLEFKIFGNGETEKLYAINKKTGETVLLDKLIKKGTHTDISGTSVSNELSIQKEKKKTIAEKFHQLFPDKSKLVENAVGEISLEFAAENKQIAGLYDLMSIASFSNLFKSKTLSKLGPVSVNVTDAQIRGSYVDAEDIDDENIKGNENEGYFGPIVIDATKIETDPVRDRVTNSLEEQALVVRPQVPSTASSLDRKRIGINKVLDDFISKNWVILESYDLKSVADVLKDVFSKRQISLLTQDKNNNYVTTMVRITDEELNTFIKEWGERNAPQ